jgi:hypothetical protein
MKMNARFLKDIVDAVFKYTHNTSKDEIVMALQKKFADKECIVWSTDDILLRAKELGYKITNEQAREILCNATNDYSKDMSRGVRWSSFDDYVLDCLKHP